MYEANNQGIVSVRTYQGWVSKFDDGTFETKFFSGKRKKLSDH